MSNRYLLGCCTFVFLLTCHAGFVQAQAAPQTGQGSEAASDAVSDISVTVGKSALLDFASPVTRVAIASGDIAEASAVSLNEVMVNGKTVGNTSLIVWQKNGQRQFFNILVHTSRVAVEDQLAAIRRELKVALPNQDVTVAQENGLVFLRGTVKDIASSDRAAQIVAGAGKVINLLYVSVPAAPAQVLLKVRFASVDLSKTKQLGMNIFSTGAANTLGTVSTQQFPAPTVSLPSAGSPAVATIGNALNLFAFRPDINLGVTIQALENAGVVQVLAEPNILAQDGKQASFLAGGEYPYPVVQGGIGVNTVTIQFKEFGIRLNFIPTITPRGTIRLQVAPEVSSLDFTNAVTISGFQIPAISVRRVNTEVELQEKQSFVIGGLLDNRENKTLSKIPFIGDVPILGKFFNSINKTRTNTELVVIVTPEFATPMQPGEKLPTPSFPDEFLNSKSTAGTQNPTATTPPAPPAATMPVEDLKRSMQPEQPLRTNDTIGPTTGMVPVGMGTSTGVAQGSTQ